MLNELATSPLDAGYIESSRAAQEAVDLLKRRGIEEGIYARSTPISASEGKGYSTLWALYWVVEGRADVDLIRNNRMELQKLLGYMDNDGKATLEGRKMHDRLKVWYACDDCD